MSSLHRLNRLALKGRIQNLNSSLAFSCRKYQIRFAYSSSRNYSKTRQDQIWRSDILTRPPVASYWQQSSSRIYFNQKRHAAATVSTKIENFLLPDIGEGISEVVIKGWQVKVGDVVKEFDPICEVESDKATATISSRYEGTIRNVHYEVGDMAKVGRPLVAIEVLGSPAATDQPQIPHDSKHGTSLDADTAMEGNVAGMQGLNKPKRQVAALPSIRRFAHEMGVDLSLIKATGSRGQILKEDVLAFINAPKSKPSQDATSSGVSSTLSTQKSKVNAIQPPQSMDQSTSLVPIRGIQRAMFKIMTESLKIPHFNYADEIDLTHLIAANSASRLKDDSIGRRKIANFAFIIKMVSLALREYPQLNASIDESGENLIYKHYHNIGVAVDTQAGLVVPNIKNVQDLSVEQVNSELLRLRELGYASKLGPADLSGATITLSNIGAVGGTFGVPVIVAPEIVIGALGRTRKLPRFNSESELEARQIMEIVWSADHRVVDGATLSRFSNLLKNYLEAPHSALLKLT